MTQNPEELQSKPKIEVAPSESQPSPSSSSYSQREAWIKIQDSLKEKLITADDFSWRLLAASTQEGEVLRYVGGADISFSKEDPSIACGGLVVLDVRTLEVVYEDFAFVKLQVPYVPGFLAFREAPVLLGLLERMKNDCNPLYPQLLMVDGNGLLHPRGFGLACHLGVLANLPTVGVGKNLHHVDGLTESGVRQLLEAKENSSEEMIALKGSSGHTWGMAIKSSQGSVKPIYISIGHRISLDTAIAVVKMTCKYRVPEPVRQADIRSREYLQKHQHIWVKSRTASVKLSDMEHVHTGHFF